MARIMIVEDNRVIGSTLSLLVECSGHAVTLATSGAEALDQLARCEHEVLFTDVNMPAMDGFALAAKVKELYPRTVFAFLSGETTPALQARGMKLGALEFVQKPIRFDDFKLVLKRALHRAEKLRAARKAPADSGERTRDHVAEEMEMLLPGQPLALVRGQLAELALSRRHALVEAPAGMLTPELLHFLHRIGPFAAGPLVVHDAAAEPLTGVEALLASAPEGLVVLANVDAVPAGLQHALALQLRSTDRMRLVATVAQSTEALKADGRLFGPLAAHLSLCFLQLPPLARFEAKIPEIFAAALPRVPAYPLGKAPVEVDAEAARALSAYTWPGNLAELWEQAGRIALRLREPRLTLAQLPETLCGTQVPRLEQQLRAAEIEHVRRALRLFGSVAPAAKALGVPTTALEAYQRSSAAESFFTLKNQGRAPARAKTEPAEQPAERLLLVVGDEIVRDTAVALLAARGVEVAAVGDGLAAVAALLLSPRAFTAVAVIPPVVVWQAAELGSQLLRLRPQLRLGLLGDGATAAAPFHAAVPGSTDLDAALGDLTSALFSRTAA